MFCTNCGKELSEGTKFCVFCGSSQEAVETKVEYKAEKKTTGTTAAAPNALAGILEKFSVLDLVIMFLYGIIIGRWMLRAVSNIGYVWETFGWIYDSVIVQILFTVLFFAGFAGVALICVVGIRSVIVKKYHISISLFLAAVCLLVRIIAFIIGRIYWPDAIYGIFYMIAMYSRVCIFTFIISLINSALLYSKNVANGL